MNFKNEVDFITSGRLNTPVTFYNENLLVQPLKLLQEHLPEADIYYAVKSCYHPPLLKVLSKRGIGAEVLSELEFDLAVQNGFKNILVNGMGRSFSLFLKAIEVNAIIIIDTANDIKLLIKIINETNLRIKIGVRISLKSSDFDGNNYLTGEHPLGNTVDSEFFKDFIEFCANKNVSWEMLHAHFTINETSSIIYEMAIKQLASTTKSINDQFNIKPKVINIGGGYEVYVPSRRAIYASLFKQIGDAAQHYLKDYVLAIEPGRYISAYAGYSLGRVLDIKNMGEKTWVITDIGTNTLIPIPNARYELWWPKPLPSDSLNSYTIGVTDGITSPANTIIEEVGIAQLPQIGDFICIGNTGAYTDVYSTFWAFAPHQVGFVDSTDNIVMYRTSEDIERLHRIYFHL